MKRPLARGIIICRSGINAELKINLQHSKCLVQILVTIHFQSSSVHKVHAEEQFVHG
jgi:hypothetical protein